VRIAFAGTPDFAARALDALLGAGHEAVLVLTQPDRPAGRGLRPVAGAVKRLARERGLAHIEPPSLRDASGLTRLAAARPEVLVVAAYGLLLPPAALEIPPHGALNIHASLLPRWRGAAPIQRALLAGDRETGISIMKLDAGLDTGPLLAQRRVAIAADEDAQSLHDRLAALGGEMIVAALDALARGEARFAPQPAEGVTYARKLDKSEVEIDWAVSAAEIERKVRALRPRPGAQTRLREIAVKLWRARPVAGSGAPGAILVAGPGEIVVACGEGALAVSELQRAGGRRLAAAEFLRGVPLERGERLGAAR
jgi:methionyl-tRNA formyltransferase